jgi:fructose-specific phosphotransferase system IIC component
MRKRAIAIGARQGLLYGVIAVLISWRYPFLKPVFITTFLFTILGAYYAVWYIRKGALNKDWLHLLFWSNAITWLIPFIGFFTCSATQVINHINHGDDRKVFKRLTSICFVLSFINAAILAKYVL